MKKFNVFKKAFTVKFFVQFYDALEYYKGLDSYYITLSINCSDYLSSLYLIMNYYITCV
jgi:hypothetical protein